MKRIRFDEASQTYKLSKSYKKGLLTVEYERHKTFYKLERSIFNPPLVRYARILMNNSPYLKTCFNAYYEIKYWHPRPYLRKFHDIYRWFDCKINDNYCSYDCDASYKNHLGYIVLNKPKYKPNDTLKLKAFVVNRRGKPVNTKVKIVLFQLF